MQSINRLLLLTTTLSILILIGAGEGKVIIGWLEIIAPFEFIKGYSKFSFTGTTDDKTFSISLIALVGQIILFVACLNKRQSIKFKLVYIGLFISIFSFLILTVDFSNFNDYIFWSGVPFLISAIFLLIMTIKTNIQALH